MMPRVRNSSEDRLRRRHSSVKPTPNFERLHDRRRTETPRNSTPDERSRLALKIRRIDSGNRSLLTDCEEQKQTSRDALNWRSTQRCDRRTVNCFSMADATLSVTTTFF